MVRLQFLLIITLLFQLFAGCEEESSTPVEDAYEIIDPEDPLQKGDRLFGINISESTQGFDASFQKALNVGIQMQELNLPWTEIETSQGDYNDPYGGILAATSYYGERNIDIGLSLAVINTVQWEVPAYLDPADCNSQAFISAFVEMADWVLNTIPDHVTVSYLSIGNEVDLVLESSSEWLKYTEFYRIAADSLRKKYPAMQIGVKTTVMHGLLGSDSAHIQDINQYSDAVMLNYYPQNERAEVLDPQIVETHFSAITNMFTGQEIWFTELGYQSGENYCNSSETKQARFYHHLFSAWDDHADQIPYILVNWLHDQSPQVIEKWKNYYGDDPALVEYLSTLGLRNYDGTDKTAWKQVTEEANQRGWK